MPACPLADGVDELGLVVACPLTPPVLEVALAPVCPCALAELWSGVEGGVEVDELELDGVELGEVELGGVEVDGVDAPAAAPVWPD